MAGVRHARSHGAGRRAPAPCVHDLSGAHVFRGREQKGSREAVPVRGGGSNRSLLLFLPFLVLRVQLGSRDGDGIVVFLQFVTCKALGRVELKLNLVRESWQDASKSKLF
jgi:hypothetical protein